MSPEQERRTGQMREEGRKTGERKVGEKRGYDGYSAYGQHLAWVKQRLPSDGTPTVRQSCNILFISSVHR